MYFDEGRVAMKPIIYVDVLFLINLAINLLLLACTRGITRNRARQWRIWLGALLGAAYAVFIFFPALSILYSTAAKLVFSALLVLVSFRIARWREYVRILLIFYAVSFVFAGTAFAMLFMTDIGSQLGAAVSNGIFYLSLPLETLVISTVVSYALIRAGYAVYSKKMSQGGNIFEVTICLCGKSTKVLALMDTGNSLTDPLTGTPVIVAEYESINGLFTPEMRDAVRHGGDAELSNLLLSGTSDGIRFYIVPFASLGKRDGVLIAFKPDGVMMNGECITNVLVGMYTKRLAKSEEDSALLNPMIVNTNNAVKQTISV